jgi:hypothetical protein
VRSNPRASIRLEESCEKLKQLMSSNEKTKLPLNIECLMDDKDVTSYMIASDFEALSEGILKRIKATCERLIVKMTEVHPLTSYLSPLAPLAPLSRPSLPFPLLHLVTLPPTNTIKMTDDIVFTLLADSLVAAFYPPLFLPRS